MVHQFSLFLFIDQVIKLCEAISNESFVALAIWGVTLATYYNSSVSFAIFLTSTVLLSFIND